ncbi:MAG: peptidylprolyl isomerase [Acetobacteraceae bacterium]|nr:peptidylprolyl isomerase [Acetobacteraceae bacterium]
MLHRVGAAWRCLPRVVLAALAVLALGVAVQGALGQSVTPDATQPASAQPAAGQAAPGGTVVLSPPLKASDLAPDQPIKGATDPVVGSVDGHLIYLSELGRATQALPENLRDLPFDMLFPVLLDRMVDHESLVLMARRRSMDDNPAVKREIQAAIDRILEGAYLSAVATPKVTEQAILDRYNKQYANRPAAEEVHARHILVATEDEAKAVLTQLKGGADFATLAKQYSKDPDGARGGDLGFFRREQVWPTFADMAFTLQPGQVGPTPIHNEFGWHVIKVDERRLVGTPSFSDMHEAIRQELLQQAVQDAIDQARAQMTIHKFNLDGTEMNAALRTVQPQAKPASASAPKVAPLPR